LFWRWTSRALAAGRRRRRALCPAPSAASAFEAGEADDHRAALRSFLRYLRYRGDIALDLVAAVPIVANWSMPSIPRAIAADQVRQLLASIDRHTATGRRDYAVLLLLARLGLRSGEAALLELDDLDWNAGRLSVRGKSGRRNELPLPAEVGKAIAAYLRRGRPESTSRRVFLRAKAPIRGFRGASGVGSIVRHSLQRAGIDAPTMGAHQFRHGLATEMLRQGASLGEIGELLGHRHPQTTKIYTKVDLKALRTLALPWPGGGR
jgi:integrase/recombinase XerD